MSPSSTVLAALRRATAQAHHHIEAVAPLHALASRTSLVGALQAWERLHAHWEPAALAVLPPADAHWLRQRSRRPALQADLVALGARPATVAATQTQLDLTVPDAAAAWGGIYVIEGSTLGGQLIAKHLRDTLGLDAHSGARYYSGHGTQTAALWRDCTARLQQALGEDAGALQRACDAAVQVFGVMTGLMREALNPAAVPPAPAPRQEAADPVLTPHPLAPVMSPRTSAQLADLVTAPTPASSTASSTAPLSPDHGNLAAA